MPGRRKEQSSTDRYSLGRHSVPGSALSTRCLSDQDQGWLVDQMLVVREQVWGGMKLPLGGLEEGQVWREATEPVTSFGPP